MVDRPEKVTTKKVIDLYLLDQRDINSTKLHTLAHAMLESKSQNQSHLNFKLSHLYCIDL